jgi:hypothetical protein
MIEIFFGVCAHVTWVHMPDLIKGLHDEVSRLQGEVRALSNDVRVLAASRDEAMDALQARNTYTVCMYVYVCVCMCVMM